MVYCVVTKKQGQVTMHQTSETVGKTSFSFFLISYDLRCFCLVSDSRMAAVEMPPPLAFLPQDLGAERAQSVKYLPQKHEDLNSTPIGRVKGLRQWCTLVIPELQRLR